LKNDIVLIQPTSSSASDPPDVLLPLITQFLQNHCGSLVSPAVGRLLNQLFGINLTASRTPQRVILLSMVIQWVFVHGREMYEIYMALIIS
jgi:hypothetical protein